MPTNRLTPVETELAALARLAKEWSQEVPTIAGELARVRARLEAEFARSPSDRAPAVAALQDRLLAPAEAAGLLRVSVRWLYRHASRLPFTRRLSRKALRFSEAELIRYLARRTP